MAEYNAYNTDWAAAVQAGANILGSAAQMIYQGEADSENRYLYRQTRDMQRQWALEDYEKVLRDSSPAEQVRRLKEAGLNPNLVYGSGNIQTGVTSAPTMNMPTPPYKQRGLDLDLSAINAFGYLLDMKIKEAQIKNIKADSELKESQSIGQTFQNDITLAQSKYAEDMAAFDWHLKDWATDIAEKEGKIRQLEYNIRLIKYAAETNQEINIGDFENFIVAQDTPAFEAFKQDIEAKKLTKEEVSARIKALEKGVALTASEILLNAKKGANIAEDTERIRLENNLRKNGLNPNDPVWMRMGVQMLAEYLGIDLNDVIEKYKNQ